MSSQDGAAASRWALAREVSRRLIYVSGSEFKELSSVQAAKKKLDELFAAGLMPQSEHRHLFYLLQNLEGGEIDRYDLVDDLVQEVATSLTIWPEVFSSAEFQRLQGLL